MISTPLMIAALHLLNTAALCHRAGASSLQMRYIHNQPFTPSEIEDYRKIVFANIVGGMRSIIDTMDELGLAIATENRRYVALVDSEPAINTGEVFPPKYLEALRRLWEDEQVQACYARAHEYALQENLTYFYEEGKLETLFDPSYRPGDDDILRYVRMGGC